MSEDSLVVVSPLFLYASLPPMKSPYMNLDISSCMIYVEFMSVYLVLAPAALI